MGACGRRRPFLVRPLENTLVKLLKTLDFYDEAGREKLAIGEACEPACRGLGFRGLGLPACWPACSMSCALPCLRLARLQLRCSPCQGMHRARRALPCRRRELGGDLATLGFAGR